ncbi:MAG: PAS domain-containing protein [Desulfamplus sp.]|nr:PAS domain-containing protein [Desulfamplus sp.]
MNKRRRKILWQIFPSFLIITVLSLTAVTFYSTNVFKSFFLNNTEHDLTSRAEFVKREFLARFPNFDITSSNMDIGDIDRLCKDIGQTTGTRVTIVLPSGKVVGDSFSNINSMENHKHRYEIALAMKDKKGVSIRKSGTLGESMMYIALPVVRYDNSISVNANKADHNIDVLWIVRVAISIASIEKQIRSIQKNIFIALLITVTAAAGASLFVARRITRPIEEMRNGAANFADGKLTLPLLLPDSEELFQLALTINLMAQTLDEKIKTLEDRTMELEAVLSSMREGVIAVDPDEKIITANHAAAEMFGYPTDLIKGRNIHEISRYYELQKLLSRALANADPVEDDIAIHGNGDYIYNVHSTALCNSSGAKLGILIIFHDITRIRKLETMHKDFAANVSHELKTPLTSIKGFVETLENLIQEQQDSTNHCFKDVENKSEQNEHKNQDFIKDDGQRCKHEKTAKFIKIIQKNVDRLIALINDLLALSRVEREEGATVRLEPHDITQIIQAAIDACTSIAAANNINIEYISQNIVEDDSKGNSKDRSIIALIDPILMEQAITNLIDNAIKYSASGNRVVVTCDSTNRTIMINITDYGTGIGGEHLSRIFNRFYRVDKSRSRDMGGTGLGLAIVKHIIRYHKGDISVTSTVGKGSTFKITLPAVS